MKILHVKDLFDPEANYQINEILKETPKFNHEVYLITSTDMSYFHKEVDIKKDRQFSKKYNVEILRNKPIFKISSRMYIPFLFKKIEKLNPDIVIFHGIGDFKDLNISFPKKRNYVIIRDCHMSWSASLNKFNKIYYKVFKKVFAPILNRKYDKIYSLGTEETQYLETLGIENKLISLFNHGYRDNEYFYSFKEKNEFRKKMNLNENEIVIGYVGKFDKGKQPHINLEIMNLLGKEFIRKNKIKFLFLGPQDKNYMDKIFNPLLESIDNDMRPIVLSGRRANELREVYNGIDVCLWLKQTTLSSIHAQVCHTTTVMEDEISNKERVVENENLYIKNDLEDAVKKLKNIIETKKYLKERNSWYTEKLKNREYSHQMQQKIKEWEELVEKKRGKL